MDKPMKKSIPKGVIIEGSITKHMDRRFLSSLDLIGQGDVPLIIDRVEKLSEIEYLNGTKAKDVILLYFKKTNRPLALNVTNIKTLVKIIGSTKVEDWANHKIYFYAEQGKWFGEKGFAVRIRNKVTPAKENSLLKKKSSEPVEGKAEADKLKDEEDEAIEQFEDDQIHIEFDKFINCLDLEAVNKYLLRQGYIEAGQTYEQCTTPYKDWVVRNKVKFEAYVNATGAQDELPT